MCPASIMCSPFWKKLRNSIRVNLIVLILLVSNFNTSDSSKPSSPTQYSSSTSGDTAGATNSPKLEKAFSPNEIIDIVGFGEDCSPKDGLLCDEIQNLVCDPSLETCVCDLENGYQHLSDINGEFYLDDWEVSRRGSCVRRRGYIDTSESKTTITKEERKQYEIDVVGWGEDCSKDEGPFCDENQFLTCDSTEEICVCDDSRGYVHLSDVPGGEEQHLGESDLPKSLCINKEKIIERTEQLLLGSGRKTEYVYNGQEADRSSKSVYDEMMDKYAPPEADTEGNKPDRLARFKLKREPINDRYTGDELVVNEIAKFSYFGKMTLEKIKPLLTDLLKKSGTWKKNKLTDSMCTSFLDLDRDKVATQQEYAIALLSEKVRTVVMPKAFLDMITPLPEETCITIEDLMKLEHEPETLASDFASIDENNDGCITLEEYSQAIQDICALQWLHILLDSFEMGDFSKHLDPSPEEMYVRRLMENERLDMNWEVIDDDDDGYISLQELSDDLALSVSLFEDLEDEDDEDETDEDSKTSVLFRLLDVDGDELISKYEFKLQMNLPSLTEEYQFDWLESLYELHDTDEDEVKENLEAFERAYENLVGGEKGIPENSSFSSTKSLKPKKSDRLFEIFDKNRNGEWDEVEFKLVMEFLTKYVVYGILNETVIDLMDQDADGKVSLFEYDEFFKNSSSSFQIYTKNLIAMEQTLKDLTEDGNELDGDDFIGEMVQDDDDWLEDVNDNGEEDDEIVEEEHSGLVTYKVSSKKLSKKAAQLNETLVIYKIFLRMDENKDGFLTKEDFYGTATSYKTKKSKSEIQAEFKSLDLDKDGTLTAKEVDDIENPLDLASFVTGYDALTEDIREGDFDIQFLRMDLNMDNVISKREYDVNYNVIYEDEEQDAILDWLEAYLKNSPPMNVVDPIAMKIFKEIDSNCDNFISLTEFQTKVDELRKSSRFFQSLNFKVPKVIGKTDFIFNSLDLNRDGVISYNEFHWLLLRPNRGVNQF